MRRAPGPAGLGGGLPLTVAGGGLGKAKSGRRRRRRGPAWLAAAGAGVRDGGRLLAGKNKLAAG